MQSFATSFIPNDPKGKHIITEIRKLVEPAAKNGQDSLFITQRHLLTLHKIEIPIVPDYEVVTLMEMAMSRNEKYLSVFYTDLDNHRFAYIITSPLFLSYKGSQSSFGEENDVWVKYVAQALDCEYEPLITFDKEQVQILVPKSTNPVCSLQP